MKDKAVSIQTAILESDRKALRKLQEINGHETAGETIGWLIERNAEGSNDE